MVHGNSSSSSSYDPESPPRSGAHRRDGTPSVQQSLGKGKEKMPEHQPETPDFPTPAQLEAALKVMQTVLGSMKKGGGQSAPSVSRDQSRSTHRSRSHGRRVGSTQRQLDMDEATLDKDQRPIPEYEQAMHGPHQGTYLHGDWEEGTWETNAQREKHPSWFKAPSGPQ